LRDRITRHSLLIVLFLLVALVPALPAQQASDRLIAVMGIAREIAPVESRLQGSMATNIQGIVFTSGTINAARIVTVRSSVGKTNSALATTLLLERFKPSAVIWTGTAGAVDPDLNPADVVIGTGVGYHDFGAMVVGGFTRNPTRNSGTGQTDPAFFPPDANLLAAARRAASTVKLSRGPIPESDPTPRILEGLIATGDAFVADPSRRNEIRTALKASAVEMEGAAVAQVCSRFNIPFLVIRSITDRADGQASNSYQRFVDTSSLNAAELAVATIQQFLK
jgi:adenosylhomocysteine nucleosidase